MDMMVLKNNIKFQTKDRNTYCTVVQHMNPATSPVLQIVIQQATSKLLQKLLFRKSQCYNRVIESTLNTLFEGLFIHKII